MTAKDFVKWLYPLAAKNGEISATFIVAQAALESGWGKSKVGENNLFGVTRGSWKGKTVLITTTEFLSTPNRTFAPPEEVISVTKVNDTRYKYKVKRLFRDYDTIEECLEDHFAILKKPHFAHAWPHRHSPERFVEQLQAKEMKYATSPTYVATMKQMFRTVERYTKELGLT